MLRSELVARLQQKYSAWKAADVEAMVDCVLEEISGALARGDRVEIRGFGRFSVRKRDARQGAIPVLALRSAWNRSGCHSSKRAKNCAHT